MNSVAAFNINASVSAIVARILTSAQGQPQLQSTSEPTAQASSQTPAQASAQTTSPASAQNTIASARASVNSSANAVAAAILAASANSPASEAGIILNPQFQLASRAAPMDINLNQLLNSAVLQSTLQQLPAELLARPQVIEAIVLRNTLLPSAPTTNTSPNNPLLLPSNLTETLATANTPATLALANNYRVSMQWQNRVLQFLSAQPLPTGKTVQLQINARGEVLLLPPTAAAKIAAAQASTLAAALSKSANVAATNSSATTNNPLAAALKATPLQTLQQSLRETLPKQEPLHTLLPLLQKLMSPAVRAQLPPVVGKMIEQLLQSLPKPAQLQSADGVKRALENSGTFLEARLVKANTTSPTNNEPPSKVLETDLKAQLTALLNIVRRLIPNSDPNTAAKTQTGFAQSGAVSEEELVYDPKQILRNNVKAAPRAEESDQPDAQLTQLSKLLQAGLARIQLNQLDSAVSRHSGNDAQLQVPAWVLELPLPTQRGNDNLQVRIEQHRKQTGARSRVQWTVQIAFDLHDLGKLAATLSIVEKNVAATLWAERANTHRSVQEKIDYLRAGLESVGVKVTEMQCRLGLPAERAALISQQLVDVHT